MKKSISIFFVFSFAFLACQSNSPSNSAFQNLSVADFKAKMASPDVVVLDVRTPGEVGEGKIDSALELDFRSDNFASELGKLDKEKTYLVYCRSGGRSGKTCDLMKKSGFREFYNLDGGYSAWSSQ